MSESAIHMQGVRKTFGKKVAVEGLDFELADGELCGLIGPNGAGKTTSIRMIMSILFPDKGDLSVLGRKSAVESKDRIGYLPEERGVYKKMKVGAFIRHMAALKNVPTAGVGQKIAAWLEKVQLGDVQKKKCEELSKGMQQKVQFIASVIHEPDLLILDEPFSGLDPVNMRLLRDLIREQHERGATVIFSTHVMVQAEDLCERIVMIHQGQKVLDGKLSDMKAERPVEAVLFEPLDTSATDAAFSAAERVEGVERVTKGERMYEAKVAAGSDPSGVMRGIAASAPVARVELKRPTLEDIFIDVVTKGQARDDDEAKRLRAAIREGGADLESEPTEAEEVSP